MANWQQNIPTTKRTNPGKKNTLPSKTLARDNNWQRKTLECSGFIQYPGNHQYVRCHHLYRNQHKKETHQNKQLGSILMANKITNKAKTDEQIGMIIIKKKRQPNSTKMGSEGRKTKGKTN